MSILTDALKKAEEEKRATKERIDVAESSHDENPVCARQTAVEVETPERPPRIKKPVSNHPELALALLETGTEERLEKLPDRILAEEVIVPADLVLENTIHPQILDLSLEETSAAADMNDAAIIDGLSADNSAAPPLGDAPHAVTPENKVNYEETLASVSADQLAMELGGGTYRPTLFTAKTVSSISRVDQKRNLFKWGIFSLFIFLGACLFAVFYYFLIAQDARQIPAPDVAIGIESTLTTIPAMPVITEGNASSTLSTGKDVQETADAYGTSTVLEVSDQKTATPWIGQQKTGVEAVAEIDTETNVLLTKTALPKVVASEEADTTTESVRESSQALTLPVTTNKKSQEQIETDEQVIRISKNKSIEKKSLMLKEGFNAFNDGDLDRAKVLYRNMLVLYADNRDSHLGLAAIAIIQNDIKEAFIHYKQLLAFNPDDVSVLAVMQSLNRNVNPVQGESVIKLLLRKEGENPYPFFSLGNMYARQRRWPEAQQAFFNAFRLESDNASYALNLAISLDRLEQYSTAIDYYISALSLASNNDNFNYSVIQKRIQALKTIVQVEQ